jgi:hypothetical protein
VFFTVVETAFLILAHTETLPSFITDKLDSNKIVMSLITYYIVVTGVGSYDFKVNLFFSTPVTVFTSYFMARIEENN